MDSKNRIVEIIFTFFLIAGSLISKSIYGIETTILLVLTLILVELIIINQK